MAYLSRLKALSRGRRNILCIIAGLFIGAGQVPFGFWPVALVGLFLFANLSAASVSVRQALWTGWLVGTAYFALTLSWIVEPFLVDIPRHGWMAPFALILLSGGLALFWGAASGLAGWIGGTPQRRLFVWAIALSFAEIGRGYVLTGFPWAMIGYIWTESDARGWASLVGSYGLTAITLIAIALLAAAAIRRHVITAVAGAFALAALPLGGSFVLPAPQQLEGRPVVRLIQPNAPQHEKWDPEKSLGFVQRQLEFTAASPSGTAPVLTVWPETAIPYRLSNAETVLARISRASGDTPVVIGVQRREAFRSLNSLAVIRAGGEIGQIYDKSHLVPFGEYIPFGRVTTLLGIRSLAAKDGFGFSPGPGPSLLDFGSLGRGLPLICYEAIFPQDVNGAPERPDFLLQITNDAWFGEISGPYQHLAQARMRAVEQGLPMIRAANTGVSAMIDPAGRVLTSIPLGQAGWVDSALPEPGAKTLYARTGDLPIVCILAALLALNIFWRMRKDIDFDAPSS